VISRAANVKVVLRYADLGGPAFPARPTIFSAPSGSQEGRARDIRYRRRRERVKWAKVAARQSINDLARDEVARVVKTEHLAPVEKWPELTEAVEKRFWDYWPLLFVRVRWNETMRIEWSNQVRIASRSGLTPNIWIILFML
jgi:hypothetical protein